MQTPISSATANLLPTMDVRQLIATMREFRDRLRSLVADLYTRQTLGYAAPVTQGERTAAVDGARPGDVEIPGGKYLIGATKDFPFVFDNEKWAHEVMLKPFRIARAPVANGEFLEFVEDGGY